MKNIKNLIIQISKDKNVRRALTRKSHFWFFNIFLSHHAEYDLALFHREMFKLTESSDKMVAVMAFRGSGKSTIMNLSYALWSVLGVQRKKFVLIVSKTQSQAKFHFLNIKRELEENRLLKTDMGPFKVSEDEWGMHSLIISHLDAKIVSVCREQSIRGMRYGICRPDLIICDDIEDSMSVKSKRSRDETQNWLIEEVFPAGDNNTKIIILGNLLHEDSLLMRIKRNIEKKIIIGIFCCYPLLDNDYRILWPGKYPDSAAIQKLRNWVSNEPTWEKEYLLMIPIAGMPILFIEQEFNSEEEKERYYKQKIRQLCFSKFPPRLFGPYRTSAPITYQNMTLLSFLRSKKS